MRILIRFGDNDFGKVLQTFGELLLQRVRREQTPPTQKQVADWFNAMGFTLYELVQRDHSCCGLLPEYLQIRPSQVFVDGEADAKMKTAQEWANSDSVMVDSAAHISVYLI